MIVDIVYCSHAHQVYDGYKQEYNLYAPIERRVVDGKVKTYHAFSSLVFVDENNTRQMLRDLSERYTLKPWHAQISIDELYRVQRTLNEEYECRYINRIMRPNEFKKGNMVRVVSGPLAGTVGTVVRVRPKWERVRINFDGKHVELAWNYVKNVQYDKLL